MDLHKAFDSIHWDFIHELLQALKFPKPFIQWIMTCVTNVSFRIQLNGQYHDDIEGKRGLRQGDPLSPFFLSSLWTIYLAS